MMVDSLAGNVQDLAGVLEALRELAGLKPFLRFELELAHGVVPVAQVMCGDVSLEFLEHARGRRPAGASHIALVVVEVPGREPAERELEPGLWLAVRPGPETRVAEVEVRSSAVTEDLNVLRACGGTVTEEGVLTLGEASSQGSARGVRVRFAPAPGAEPLPDPEQCLPGWHRMGLAHPRLEEAMAALTRAGAEVAVPPYRVLPGLREAMLHLPSGLVVQPVEQKLWQMLPVVAVKGLAARLTGRPLRFKTTV
jgi:hypothetical protein